VVVLVLLPMAKVSQCPAVAAPAARQATATSLVVVGLDIMAPVAAIHLFRLVPQLTWLAPVEE
jgi:hypothetical protein